MEFNPVWNARHLSDWPAALAAGGRWWTEYRRVSLAPRAAEEVTILAPEWARWCAPRLLTLQGETDEGHYNPYERFAWKASTANRLWSSDYGRALPRHVVRRFPESVWPSQIPIRLQFLSRSPRAMIVLVEMTCVVIEHRLV